MMHNVFEWIEDHPVVFGLIIWPILTALITSIFSKPSDAFAAKYPRLAALRRIPSDAGINLPKLLGNVLVMLTGGKAASAPAFPDEEPTKKEGKSLPPTHAIVFLVGAVLAARVLLSCAAAAESSYTAQQLQCVDRAKTLEESRACRAEVDRAWHVDAGADR